MQNPPGFENLVTCPYNIAHQLLPHRVAKHLIKCARQYPEIQLDICPFNVSHRVKSSDMPAHKLQCPERKSFDHYVNAIGVDLDKPEIEVQVPKQVTNPFLSTDESWDDIWTGSYDPQKVVVKKDVVRLTNGMTPSERREFREQEHRRLREIEAEKEKKIQQ